MEQILSMDEAIKELREKNENNETVEQFTNPKSVAKKINAAQIILRQTLMSILIILIMLLFKIMLPDLYEQISEYLNIRFSLML